MTTTIYTTPGAEYAVDDSTANDTITLTNGPTESGYQTTEVTTAGGANQTIFANQSEVFINGENNGDNVVLDNSNQAAGLQTLTIEGLGGSGAITGSNPSASGPDITVATLDLQAGGNIGTSSRALQTQVGYLTAVAGESSSGNVNISNGVAAAITLSIGSLSATGTAGNAINLTNNGSIDAYGSEIVANGSITITTAGATSDINIGSSNSFAIDSDSTVVLQSGEDINLGDGLGTNTVYSAAGQLWEAGRNITLDGTGEIENTTAGNITIVAGLVGAGGDITMVTTPGTVSGDPLIENFVSTGTITLETATGGTLTVATNGTGDAIASANGEIMLIADTMAITAKISSGTARTVLEPATAGRAISLGANASGVLGLTQAELNEITAGVVQVGGVAAGNVTIASQISTLTGSNVLTLISNGSVSETAFGYLALSNLNVVSTGSITLGSIHNDIATLAADSAGSVTVVNGTNSLTIGTVDGDAGILTTNSAINLTADSMTFSQQVNAGTGIVTLAPYTTSQQVSLGSGNVSGTLGLTNAELGDITASVLRVDAISGNITLGGAVSVHAGFGTLSLTTGGAINLVGNSIAVTNLALDSGNTIDLNGSSNAIGTLAFYNASGTVGILDSTALTIGAVDGIASSSNVGSTTSIIATGSLTFAANLYSVGSTTLTSSSGQILDGGNGTIVDVTTPSLTLSASTGIGTSGDFLETQVGTLNATTATGNIYITNDSAVPGTLSLGEIQVTGTSGNISLINYGTIESITSGDNIFGPNTAGANTITVQAIGANSDVDLEGQASAFSVYGAGSGLVEIEAGRDINLGGSTSGSLGAVRNGTGSIVLVAGRNLTIDPNSYVRVFGASGSITATAGGNFTMTTSPGSLGDMFETAGGTISLAAGAGATMTLTSTATDSVESNNGNITLTADALNIGTGKVVTAGTGNLLIQPVTSGQLISLGTATGGLTLSNTELMDMIAKTLTIGSATAGEITVGGTLSNLSVTNLTLDTGSGFAASTGSTVNIGSGTFTIDFDQNGLGGTADLRNAAITAGVVDVVGGSGSNVFLPGNTGNEVLTGNGSSNTVSFISAAQGVTVNLATGSATNGSATDTLSDINSVIGSAFNDTFISGASGETFTGGGGSDTFEGTSANLNGDTITDLGVGDKIVITDGSLANFSSQLSGTTLSFDPNTSVSSTFDTLTLANAPLGHFIATADPVAGVDLTLVGINEPADNFTGNNGGSDILWRNTSGTVDTWIMQGGVHNAGSGIGTVDPTQWQILGTGDFAGNDTDDVLWQDTQTGLVDVWTMQNGQHTADTFLGNVSTAQWKFVGTGDFFGTGTDDIVWQNLSSGAVDVWTMQNGQHTNDTIIGTVPGGWQIAGIGDLSGDGTDDLILQNTGTGEVDTWMMQNGAHNAGGDIGSPSPSQWQLVGTGDFYGNGTDDLLWRDTQTGLVDIWQMSNGQHTADSFIGTIDPTQWQIVGIGDYFGNGTDDILWQDSQSGLIDVWTIQNGQHTADTLYGSLSATQWTAQPANFPILPQ